MGHRHMSKPETQSAPPGIDIRPYNHTEDYKTVLKIWNSVGNGIHVSFSDEPAELEKLLRVSPGLFFLAIHRGNIIGTIMGGFDGRRGLIYHLAVLPEYQNRHIGSYLMNYLENELYKRGCRKIYLFIVPENIKTADFYQKLGYEQMSAIPFTKILQ